MADDGGVPGILLRPGFASPLVLVVSCGANLLDQPLCRPHTSTIFSLTKIRNSPRKPNTENRTPRKGGVS